MGRFFKGVLKQNVTRDKRTRDGTPTRSRLENALARGGGWNRSLISSSPTVVLERGVKSMSI